MLIVDEGLTKDVERVDLATLATGVEMTTVVTGDVVFLFEVRSVEVVGNFGMLEFFGVISNLFKNKDKFNE